MKHHVAVVRVQLDLVVASNRRLGLEDDLERLVDACLDGLAACNAMLAKRGPKPPGRGHPVPLQPDCDMGFEPLDPGQAKPLSDRGALGLVGTKRDPLPVAQIGDRQPVSEIAHGSDPASSARSSSASSPAQ